MTNRAKAESALRAFRKRHPNITKEWDMSKGLMNLASDSNAVRFVAMLQTAESYAGNLLSNWESEFVSSMRQGFDARETQIDLGMNPWNPTVNQWNTLHSIVSKLS